MGERALVSTLHGRRIYGEGIRKMWFKSQTIKKPNDSFEVDLFTVIKTTITASTMVPAKRLDPKGWVATRRKTKEQEKLC